MKISVKQVIVAYIIFKICQFIYALTFNSTVYDKIGFTIGLIVPLILAYFAFKDFAVFKWLISINILIAGIMTLFPSIFQITLANNPVMKIFGLSFGIYLLFGSCYLFNKTIKKQKFA